MAKGAKDPKSKATTAAPSTPPPTPTTKKNGEDEPNDSDIETPVKKPRVRSTPKKAPKKPTFHELPSSLGSAAPVTVSSESEKVDAMIGPINNQYEMLLKLHAPHQFTFVDSVMLEEGVHAGHMALVLRPARPFQFMRLPEETKRDILRLALAPEGYLAGKILVATKNNVVASKNYAEGKKDRLGFMRVSKTLYLLSRPLLYGNHFKFDDTTTLMNFLSVRSLEVKAIFTNIEIATYKKSSSLAALQTLADCTNLRRVHISTGVNLNATPEKAAKAFLQDAGHFLRSMSNARGGVDAGVNVLRFGRSQRCFGVKESDGEIRAWNDEERDRFADLLKADLFKNGKALLAKSWACICGSDVPGHVCSDMVEGRVDDIGFDITDLVEQFYGSGSDNDF